MQYIKQPETYNDKAIIGVTLLISIISKVHKTIKSN